MVLILMIDGLKKVIYDLKKSLLVDLEQNRICSLRTAECLKMEA